jgi:hypothetical protein
MPVFASESARSLKIYIGPHRALLYDPPRTNARRMIKLSMRFLPTLNHLRAPQWLLAAAAILTLCAIGCASPAPPQAPALNLPEPIKDLAAQRVGDTVELHWTTPTQTTSRVPVKGPITAQICRIPSSSAACTPIATLPVKPGPSAASDPLPATLSSETRATLLTYRIQLLNNHNRSAGLSNDAFAAAGSAPPPVQQLRTTPAPEGIQLTWTPTQSPAAIELTRTSLNPDGTPIQAPPPKAAKTSANPLAKKPPQKPQPDPLQPPAPIETKLRTPASTTAPGGTLDRTAQKNSTYRYTAQRVLTVTLDSHTLELRSPISSPIQITLRDIFPPHTPTGLEAVPGGLTPTDRSIDLSWVPNSDADLAGYFVYRQDVDSSGAIAATATRLNQTPVVGPAYRDQTAKPGRRYAYRVTAVDAAGNESPTSAPVQETLREP